MGAALPAEGTEPSCSWTEEKKAWKDALVRSQSTRDFQVPLGWKITVPVEAGHCSPPQLCLKSVLQVSLHSATDTL